MVPPLSAARMSALPPSAIHAVGSGAAVFGPSIAQRVLGYFATPGSADAFGDLANREREILGMLADGHPNGPSECKFQVRNRRAALRGGSVSGAMYA
jgi:hypothetical protein